MNVLNKMIKRAKVFLRRRNFDSIFGENYTLCDCIIHFNQISSKLEYNEYRQSLKLCILNK